MPSKNQGTYLSKALESIFGQSFQDLEVIVADGVSSDSTLSILEGWARREARLSWDSHIDSGPAEAINRAATRVKGDIIGWLNADDEYSDDAVAEAIKYLDTHPRDVLVYGHAHWIDELGFPEGHYPTKSSESLIQEFANGCFICQPTVFMRRIAWEELGGLNVNWRVSFDFDLWLRAFQKYPERIGFIDRIQAHSRIHSNSITSMQRARIAVEGFCLVQSHLGICAQHWVLNFLEEVIVAYAKTCDAETPDAELQKTLAQLSENTPRKCLIELHDRIQSDRRLELCKNGVFIGITHDGWAGHELKICIHPQHSGRWLRMDCEIPSIAPVWNEIICCDGEKPIWSRQVYGPSFTLWIPIGQSRTPEPACFLLRAKRWFVPEEVGQGSSDSRKLAFQVRSAEIKVVGPDASAVRHFILPIKSETDEAFPIYPAMLAIWHLRPFLQKRFPLHRMNVREWQGFFSWCLTDGRADYQILHGLEGVEEILTKAVSLPNLSGDEWEGQMSLAILCCGMARYRWSLGPLLISRIARKRAARAFWRGERYQKNLPISKWQFAQVYKHDKNIHLFLKRLYLPKHDEGLNEKDLIKKFGLEDLQDFSKEVSGFSAKAEIQKLSKAKLSDIYFHLPIPLRVWRWIFDLLAWLRRNPSEAERARVMKKICSYKSRCSVELNLPFGVNVFGYANGELGIGEDVRQVALALEQAGIPVCVINFRPGKNISQQDRSVDRLVVEKPKYSINLFCMTGIEHTRYVCENGLELVQGRYNIGLWPWELPDWPESCRHAYACVDEVWGISRYTAHAHRFAAPRPVLPMTLPVALGPVGSQSRRDFGLPEEAYLYFFAFDINSNAARKNPEGLIKAFQNAYPIGSDKNVGLVLKISHPETGCKLWNRIRKAAKRDSRIHLVEKTMRRPELLALFNACDCLVSLHRAEGFGRCIAEALLLGKQVVTTGFSGNVDYCNPSRVALVRYKMVPLARGDYMWGEGQEWAEPDLAHAAELMRSVREIPRLLSGSDFSFLPENVGRLYAKRLREIGEIIGKN